MGGNNLVRPPREPVGAPPRGAVGLRSPRKTQATFGNQEVGRMCSMARYMDSVKGGASAFTPMSSKGTIVNKFGL